MKHSQLRTIIREVLDEMSVSGMVGGYSTPFAFSKKGQGKNIATKAAEKLGMKTVGRPKRPSHTKLFDYLEEHGAGHYVTPNAFTSEAEMYTQPAVKYSEDIGMTIVDKPKKLSKKKLNNYSDKQK